MQHRRAIRIPDFLEKPLPPAYNSTGLAARAVFLQNVATAWQKAGDDDTAIKLQRDADDQARRVSRP